jgi:hypothetical protein
MSQHLSPRDKEAIRKSLAASNAIRDPRVSAKRIAEGYVGALPAKVSPAFRAEAFEFALIVVRDYRAELMMDLLPDP